jgi:hypothetical protein
MNIWNSRGNPPKLQKVKKKKSKFLKKSSKIQREWNSRRNPPKLQKVKRFKILEVSKSQNLKKTSKLQKVKRFKILEEIFRDSIKDSKFLILEGILQNSESMDFSNVWRQPQNCRNPPKFRDSMKMKSSKI